MNVPTISEPQATQTQSENALARLAGAFRAPPAESSSADETMRTLARDIGRLWPNVRVQLSYESGGSTCRGHSMACSFELDDDVVGQRNRIAPCVPLYGRRDKLHKSCAILIGHARY
jgi:hypothetical protein